jgi:hypothetical protein
MDAAIGGEGMLDCVGDSFGREQRKRHGDVCVDGESALSAARVSTASAASLFTLRPQKAAEQGVG